VAAYRGPRKPNTSILTGGWRDKAACKGRTVEAFTEDNFYAAKLFANKYCFGECEVRKECLEYAQTTVPLPTGGIWGGHWWQNLRRKDGIKYGGPKDRQPDVPPVSVLQKRRSQQKRAAQNSYGGQVKTDLLLEELRQIFEESQHPVDVARQDSSEVSVHLSPPHAQTTPPT